jgi:hypothetical protein
MFVILGAKERWAATNEAIERPGRYYSSFLECISRFPRPAQLPLRSGQPAVCCRMIGIARDSIKSYFCGALIVALIIIGASDVIQDGCVPSIAWT